MKWKIHDEPPVITDDITAVKAAKSLGYRISEVQE